MKNTIKRLLCLLLALCMCAGPGLGALADGEEGSAESPPDSTDAVEPETITIGDVDTRDLYVGQSLNLSCAILPGEYEGTVTWSSSDEATATVDPSGRVQALRAGGEPVVITVTVDGFPEIAASLALTVRDDGIESYTLSGGGITGGGGTYSLSLAGAVSFTLTGTAEYKSGAVKTGADWSVDEAGAKVLSFTPKGEFTVLAPGSALITAAFPEDTAQTATVAVTVADAPLNGLTVSGTGVSGGRVTLPVGGALALSAAKVPAYTFNRDAITWSSDNADVATVDANGGVRAVRNGSAVITARCGDKSASVTVTVSAAKNSAVTVILDGSGRYTFSEKTKKDKISAATAINDAVKDSSGKTYSYIKFDSAVSGDSVGTLYADSDKTAIKSGVQYYRSSVSGRNVSDLYFVPERSGTYARGFTAYDSSGGELLLGTLKIVVPREGEGGVDLHFNTTTGSSVSMSENVFESWYRQQKGSNYKLACVTFDGGGRGFGGFKCGSAAFTPGNEVKYYTRGFTGSAGSSPKYLDKVSFAAPDYTGYVSVDFTCYGGTSSSASGSRASGTLFIFVTRGGVRPVTHDVRYGSAVKLSEGDFVSVHTNAMSLSPGASARHYIELLEIPSQGTLYYNYAGAGKPGTRLTGGNFGDYEFYVNAASTYDSVSDLTYVPANSGSGSVAVRYLARSPGGESMYVGSIVFNYGDGRGVSVACGADGYAFRESDFYSGADADPVACVSFTQPESGELLLDYAHGRGVPLDSSVRLYTRDRADGSYPLGSLSYIPRAGFSGNVEIYYTAVTESGKVQNGVLTVAVTGRKDSAHFRDVRSAGSGAWASDAIDFAYKWGLVNGTGADTFSPDSTMTRAMLVTILYRCAGSPGAGGSCPFTDVAPGAYYYYPVLWAASNGIVNGTSPTTFSPDRDVSREQVATLLQRYAKFNGENTAASGSLDGYSDKSLVSSYAVEPMSWAVQRGYITSTSGGELLLSPGGSATRAQVAVMVHRFLTY